MVWYTTYNTSVPYHEMQCAHDISTGNLQDLLSPDKTSSEILIRLLKSPVILHFHNSITVNPLIKAHITTAKFFTMSQVFFFVYLRAVYGPCTNAKYPIFFQFDRKNSQSKIVFNNYSNFFHLDVLSFNSKSNDYK